MVIIDQFTKMIKLKITTIEYHWRKLLKSTKTKFGNYIMLWNTLNTNNFSFLLFNFSDFILILFSFLFDFLLDNEEACDIAVTWHVTWCDIIGLEHSRRIWKIMSGHTDATWRSWVRHEADMRRKHEHKSRFDY